MTFHVGQEVVCVDDSLPANPRHRQHPLVLKKIYVVQRCFPETIGIDDSLRTWQNWRFRPLIGRKTDISVFTEILDKENAKPRELVPAHSPQQGEQR